MTQRAVNNAIVLYDLGITPEELQTAREITEKVPALLKILQSPVVSSEKKHHLIERVFDGSGLPRHLINFYKKMSDDDEIEELADIYTEWQKLWDTAHNRVQAECVFAQTPSPEKEAEIKAFLSQKYPGKDLVYHISTDPSLLGGVRIRIGHEEYDWTYTARIRQLKDAVGQI